MTEVTPKGVVAILTDEAGHAIANCADFDTHGYGGYTQQEAQVYRVRRQIGTKMVEAYASDRLSRVIDAYDAEKLMDALIRQHGYKLSIISVGYPEEAA